MTFKWGVGLGPGNLETRGPGTGWGLSLSSGPNPPRSRGVEKQRGITQLKGPLQRREEGGGRERDPDSLGLGALWGGG